MALLETVPQYPNDLIIDLAHVPDEELEAFAFELYESLYTGGKDFGLLECHDGEVVKFDSERFYHALFTDPNHDSSAKTVMDRRRVERLRLIKSLIQADVYGSEGWQITERVGYVKRLYCVPAQSYMLWLEPRRDGGFWFSSAYAGKPWQLDRVRRGQKRLFKM